MTEASRLAPGERVGPYQVLVLLGQGGMGQVYRARDERLSREVALKVLHGDLARDRERLRRFEQEAKAAGALNHPNIVAVYDIGQADGSPYIVSELLEGATLRSRLETGNLGVRKAADYAAQMARGLAAAHDRGIVHRDLKPENLFVTKDGLVKILDFGIAKLGRSGDEPFGSDETTLSHSGTSPGTVLGTVGYMSPEQVRGLPADHRSDLFSLGAVLLEMLTGRRAFKGETAADTLSAILREDPTEAVGTASLPGGLLRVARRCLEKTPEDRFQTARDLAFALEGAATESQATAPGSAPARPRRRALALLFAAAALVTGGGVSTWLARRSAPPPAPPTYQRLTSRVGRVESARFAPDDETIVYGAEWGNSPSELFWTRAGATQSRPLGLQDAAILAISSREEMAIQLRPRFVAMGGAYEGTLARMPLAGGTPREVLEGVLSAAWSPDGKELAVIHVVGERYRLEYPIGRVLYEPDPPTWLNAVKLSRDGRRLAFVVHPVPADAGGSIAIVGVDEPMRVLASGFAAADEPSWAPGEREIWFTGSRGGSPQEVRAVTLDGRQRVVVALAGDTELADVSASGRALFRRVTAWTEIHALARGASEEVELPASELSFLSDLSDDGRVVLGTDIGQAGGTNFLFYVQKTDGSTPVWLGEGDGHALSPDGRFVLAVLLHARPPRLVIAPTGAGETRTLEAGPIARYARAVFDPTGQRVVIAGADANDVERLYVQETGGGPPRAFTAQGVTLAKIGRPVSPDGRRVAALDPDGIPAIYTLEDGTPRAVPDLDEYDVPLCWTPDGRELIVARYEESPPRVVHVDVASGRTRPWKGARRSRPSGVWEQTRLLVTPDGESYAYGYMRRMNDLYLSSALH